MNFEDVASKVTASVNEDRRPLRKKLYGFWKKLGQKAVYQIASRVLLQDRLVLYSSTTRDKFGNITALAEKMLERRIPFLWLAQEQLQAHPFRSVVSFARAKVLVIDAASPSAYLNLSRNTCLIHCWHACGVYKKIGFEAKRRAYDGASEEKRIRRIHRGIAWFVCTSEAAGQILANAFRLPLERMLVFGSPRLDAILLRATSFPVPSVYTVLYAPTYRTHAGGIRYHRPLPNANTLREALVSRFGENVCLAFRRHPTAPLPDNLRGWEDWSDLPQQEALQRTSVLITDYSSVFFDFLPFKRPVIFYVPDFDEYQRHERGLYFSPYDVFSETTCSTEQTLMRILIQYRHRSVNYEEVWQTYMSACDGKASERLCTFLQKIMKRGRQ